MGVDDVENVDPIKKERAKMSTLANRRLQDICILMYKVKHRLNMSK